jgi:hypothetical protein
LDSIRKNTGRVSKKWRIVIKQVVWNFICPEKPGPLGQDSLFEG